MASLKDYFKVNNLVTKSKEKAILKGNKYRITILSEILVRIEYSPEGKFEDRPTELAFFRDFEVPEFNLKEDDKYLVVSTKYFTLEYQKESPIVIKKGIPSSNLKIKLLGTDKVWYFGHPEARNYFGSDVCLDNIEGSTPLLKGLYSIDGFVSIDDSKSLIFNENGTLIKRGDPRVDTYVFMYRKDFGNCLSEYFKLTGKPELVPRYALGIWWNRNVKYSFDEIKELTYNFKRNGMPISILLLGDYWHVREANGYKNLKTGYSFNRELINDPEELVNYLHKKNINLGLKIDPSEGIMNHEEHYPEMAANLGINDNRVIPFNIFNPDFLIAYINNLIEPLTNYGVDFFWLNYYNKNNLASLRALNHYHYLESKKDKNKRGMILSRNGLTSAHRYPVHYSGETLISWKTLSFLPYFNSSASNVGLSWWSHDIGGYKEGIEDGELYTRYVQLGTFSPIFRISVTEGKYYKREPWKWEVKIQTLIKEYTALRHRLIPYIYSEGYKYYQTGLPLILPLYYYYPDIIDEPYYKNEYYFGSELFVSPITKQKDTIMNRVVERIFLPAGIWYEFKTGKKVLGNKKYVSFYKDEDYPVFAKCGAIIPMTILNEEDLNNTNSPAEMEIQIFPGANNTYHLFEDDGVSNLYKEGYYMLTDLAFTWDTKGFSFNIRPVEGKSGVIPETRSYKLIFRNTKLPNKVVVREGPNELKTKYYEDEKNFIVEIPYISTNSNISVTCEGEKLEIDAVKLINEDIDAILTDLLIETRLKEKISNILFGDLSVSKKRIELRKLRKDGLESLFIRLFIRLLEYVSEI